jgi:hypothetical protein
MNHLPPSPCRQHWDHFEFFKKFAEIFASQGAPPVSTTPVANFATGTAGVVDTWQILNDPNVIFRGLGIDDS